MNLRAAPWSAEQAKAQFRFGMCAGVREPNKAELRYACTALQNASHRRGTRGDIREVL